MIVTAVTGTNGKTSTVEFVRQIFQLSGYRAASFGTLGLITDQWRDPSPPISVGKHAMPAFLGVLEGRGVEAVAFEAFSSALESGLLDLLNPHVAAFTNFSRDHLDHHGTMKEYFRAKQRLFENVMQPGSAAVLNADAPESREIQSICKKRRLDVFTYGRTAGADFRLLDAEPLQDGTSITIAFRGRTYHSNLDALGRMMLSNALCALASACAAGVNTEQAIDALPALRSPVGRVERIAIHEGAEIYVDYAHTPAALAALLHTLRARRPKRLILVFGCGGGRDRGKRYLMGEFAHALADIVFITDDNPRNEDPTGIRADILRACPNATDVPQRREAISQAVGMLRSGDLLVIAGKGHEEHQIVGKDTFSFSDREVIQKEIAQQKNKAMTGYAEGVLPQKHLKPIQTNTKGR